MQKTRENVTAPTVLGSRRNERRQFAANCKGDNLAQIIQLVSIGYFFGYFGNLVLDRGFNSSSLLQNHIHGNPNTNFSFRNSCLKNCTQESTVSKVCDEQPAFTISG